MKEPAFQSYLLSVNSFLGHCTKFVYSIPVPGDLSLAFSAYHLTSITFSKTFCIINSCYIHSANIY